MSWYLRNLMARGGYMEAADAGEGGGASGGSVGGASGGDATGASGAAGGNAVASAGAGEGGSKSGPTDAEAKLIKEVMEKKAKLKEQAEKIAALEAQTKRFEGIDPDAVRALLEQQKAEQTKQLEAKGEWDRLKAQMAEEHGKEKSELSSKLSTYEQTVAQLQGMIGELTVGNAFGQSQFIQQELALTPGKARAVFGGHFEFKDGQVVAYDKPAGAAERTPLVDAQGEPLNFESALKKLVDADPDRESLLKSKAKQGAGSKTAPKTATPPESKVSVAGKERIAAALTSGILRR